MFETLEPRRLLAADLSATYEWKPVSIGAGGFVTGFVTSPLDANVRFARTDVGNAYRWDAEAGLWKPLLVYNADGTGLPSDIAKAPFTAGIQSIAVDPKNVNVVYVAFQVAYSSATGYPRLGVNVYKSIDGGRSFTSRGNLNTSDNPNGDWRALGERLAVDPNNSNVVYFGTENSGLYRSVDGGLTFSNVSVNNALDPLSHVGMVQFDPRTTTAAFGQSSVSSIVYASQVNARVSYTVTGGSWSCTTYGGRSSVYAQSKTTATDPSLTTYAVNGNASLDNYTASALVSLPVNTVDKRAGVLARYSTAGGKASFYGVFIEGTGGGFKWTLHKSVAGVLSTLATGPLDYTAGAFQSLQISVNGTTIAASSSADGTNFTSLGSVNDTSLATGRFGFSTHGTAAGFDDLSVVRSASLQYTSDFTGNTQAWQKADVFRSTDGGVSWTGITDNVSLNDTAAGTLTLDSAGNLWAVRAASKTIWKYNGSVWTSYNVASNQNIGGIAVDPTDVNRIFVVGKDSGVSRSLNGGTSWTNLGSMLYANTFSWLPQPTPGWRSNGGIYLDKAGSLWIPQGNEGVVTYKPLANNSESSTNPPRWTISSKGIEELVTHDVVLLPGSGDKAVVAVEDATAMYIDDPDQFTAKQVSTQTQLISNGTGLAYNPTDPNYVVVTSSDINYTSSGANFSSYSTDGGKTWQRFASVPTYVDAGGVTRTVQTGSIAVSARGNWGVGSDHLVYLPNHSRAPYFSKDGGQTWTQTTSFTDGGFWTTALKQRMLKADPTVPDKYYLKTSYGPFYVSVDGGETWASVNTTLPTGAVHGHLEVNRNLANDLWWAAGYEGAFGGTGWTSAQGIWRSTNGGTSWLRLAKVDIAASVTIGKGSGKPGDTNYSVYIYGKLTGDNAWGVFRSNNAGADWNRVAFFPYGITDQLVNLGASWDTYGLLYGGFQGNSFVYGKLTDAAPTVSTPASANPASASGTTTMLSVLGSDDQPESNLTYTWATTGTPPAPVTFSVNASNAAKTTTATFNKPGTYDFLVTIADAAGQTVTSPVSVFVDAPPPAIAIFSVNDGSANRSMVTRLLVKFSKPVTLSPGALVLGLHPSVNGGSAMGIVPGTITWSSFDGGLSYAAAFSGLGVTGGSLADGGYRLTINASLIQDALGQTLATAASYSFHRLFGDINGSGTTNNLDYLNFQRTLGKSVAMTGCNAGFDFDASGAINNFDFLQFQKRLGKSIALS